MYGEQINGRKRAKDFMLMYMNETMDHQLDMASNVCWYDHVLEREDDPEKGVR